MAIFGVPPYGIGTPAVVARVRGKVYRNPYTGRQNGARKIDPVARDYVIDTTTGQSVGMTPAQQQVYLAVKTAKGSSAMRELGQTLLKIKRIGPNIERQVDMILRGAVDHIVKAGVIEVVETLVVMVRTGVVLFRLRWRDISTSDVQTTDVAELPMAA